MFYTRKFILIRNLFFVILTFCLGSCMLLQNGNNKDYHLHLTPPNGVKIGENQFYDQTEMRNIDWREYMWWTKRMYGSNSDEYLASIPDSTVWKVPDTCMNLKMQNYLRLSRYEDFPVVGISQKQAELYSKWRADRVFEYILVRYGKLKYDTAQNRETCFTIERYMNGKIRNHKPDPNFRYYPEYRLPTIQEWKKAVHYADSVEQTYLQKRNSETNKKIKANWPEFQSCKAPCIFDSLKVIPLRIVNSGFVPERKNPIFNLRGNVSEWTSEKEITVGGGWIHNRQQILTTDTFQTKTQNAWTGLRNICEWKEYKRNATK